MSVHWSDIVFPGRKVKVKVKDKHEVVQCHYVSKLSYWHELLHYYSTAKVYVSIPSLGLEREYKFII